jgi:hypothetical protein
VTEPPATTVSEGGTAATEKIRLALLLPNSAELLVPPDGRSVWRSTQGNLASQIPLRTHRWDESDRVFLACCSSAEPASASSIHSAHQSFNVRSVSDPPAGPCVVRDCARESRFPIHPTVCFKVGRLKWMSGHAAIALVLPRDRGQFATLTICRLGEPLPPSQRESPFPVDFTYHGWPCQSQSSLFWVRSSRLGTPPGSRVIRLVCRHS